MAAVAVTRESTGAKRDLAVAGRRRHQLKEREANVPLEVGVALDHDVRTTPALAPRGTMLGEKPVEAQVLGLGERPDCERRLRGRVCACDVRGQALESSALRSRHEGVQSCSGHPTVTCVHLSPLPRALASGSMMQTPPIGDEGRRVAKYRRRSLRPHRHRSGTSDRGQAHRAQ